MGWRADAVAGFLGTSVLIGCAEGSPLAEFETGAPSFPPPESAASSSSTGADRSETTAETHGEPGGASTPGPGIVPEPPGDGETTTGPDGWGSGSSSGVDEPKTPIPTIPEGPHPPPSTRHAPRPLGTTAAPWGYWEYLPPTYAESGPFPLIVFLHGLGENGDGTTQLGSVLTYGPPMLIQSDIWISEAPFVVLSPQNSDLLCPSVENIESFLDYAIEAYDVAPDRVYLTGLSCGATGAWNYLAHDQDPPVAAAVLIAGEGRIAEAAAGCELGQVPIWGIHGDADPLVSVQGTIAPINALLDCEPPADAQMTIYPGVGHDSWTQTYDLSAGHNIYAWMLER